MLEDSTGLLSGYTPLLLLSLQVANCMVTLAHITASSMAVVLGLTLLHGGAPGPLLLVGPAEQRTQTRSTSPG